MRLFKKGFALLLALTMILSTMGVSVLAAPAEDDVVGIYFTVDKVNVGQGQSLVYTAKLKSLTDSTLSIGQYNLYVPYDSAQCEVTVTEINGVAPVAADYNTVSLAGTNKEFRMIKDVASNPISVDSTNGFVIAKFNVTVNAAATAGNDVELVGLNTTSSNAYDAEQAKLRTYKDAMPTVNVKKVVNVATVGAVADQTVEVGTTLDAIKTALADIDVTVNGANVETDPTDTTTVNIAAADWSCEDFAVNTLKPTGYTFTGTVKSTDDGLVVAENKTATVKVIVAPISDAAITAATGNVTVDKENGITEDEIKAGLPAATTGKVAIKKGAIEDTFTVASWGEVADYATSDSGRNYDVDDTITVNGTVTATTSDNGFFTVGSTAITATVTVVPDNISGGTITVDNVVDYGNAKVTVVVPKATIAAMNAADPEAKRTITVTIPGVGENEDAVASYVVTEDDINTAKAADGTDFTRSFTMPKSMHELGYASDATKNFNVNVTVGGTKLLNGTTDAPVTGTVDVAVDSTPSGLPTGGGLPAAKKYAVTTEDAENGTFEVSAASAAAGETVTVTTKPAEGYKTKAITVVKNDGTNVMVDQAAKTFVMPAAAVTVKVEFEEGEEVVAPVEPGKFGDVADDFWAAEYIYALKEAGIVGGKTETEFDPEGLVTRAEFTKMVVGLFGYKATTNDVQFADCTADDWFTPYVAAAVEAGVITGVSETEFAPNDTISREDACTILGRALNLTAKGEVEFADAADIADYAAPYVALLSELGYVNGYEDGTFAPKAMITRAEAAKIIAGIYADEEAGVSAGGVEAEVEADADVEVEADVEAETEVKADAEVEADAKAETDETVAEEVTEEK